MLLRSLLWRREVELKCMCLRMQVTGCMQIIQTGSLGSLLLLSGDSKLQGAYLEIRYNSSCSGCVKKNIRSGSPFCQKLRRSFAYLDISTLKDLGVHYDFINCQLLKPKHIE
ncbi:hypothetical protein ACLB2K_026424 [Fragaria x ananassa]